MVTIAWLYQVLSDSELIFRYQLALFQKYKTHHYYIYYPTDIGNLFQTKEYFIKEVSMTIPFLGNC